MCTKKGAIISKTGQRFGYQKRKYHNDPQKKKDAAKKRYYNKKESIKQYKRGKYLENEHQKLCIRKQSIRKILKCNKHTKYVDTKRILKLK